MSNKTTASRAILVGGGLLWAASQSAQADILVTIKGTITTTCTVTSPTIELDYGPFDILEAQGKELEKDITLRCSGPTKVNLTLPGGLTSIPIVSGSSTTAKADLLINDIVPGKSLAMIGGNNILALKSTLDGVFEPGTFSGSATLTLNIE